MIQFDEHIFQTGWLGFGPIQFWFIDSSFPEVELQMGRIRVALEERLRSPELSVDEAVNSRGPHGPGWEFPVWCWRCTKGILNLPQKNAQPNSGYLGIIWFIEICRLMVGVLIGLIGVTTWLTYPPVIKNWCLSALLPIASFKCMIWMIYIYIIYIYAWIESDFHVGVSYPSITFVANCTDVYRLPFIPNGTKWSTREI